MAVMVIRDSVGGLVGEHDDPNSRLIGSCKDFL